MSKVRVHRATDLSALTADTGAGRLAELRDAIRRRAFELFQKRGGELGKDLDDWLQAERDLFYTPHAAVNENEASYRMLISTPGFDASDIEVIATPRELLVEAKKERRLEPKRDSLRAGALESRTLFRRFDLTAPIETDHATARIDEGSLTIEAPKKLASQASCVAARAAAA